MEKILQLILSTRILPDGVKLMSRILIPKTKNYKYIWPITEVYYFTCYLSSVLGTSLYDGLEVINGYPLCIKSHRKVILCYEMKLIHLLIMEEVNQHQNLILENLDDDEENYYDLITLEFQFYSLLRLILPRKG